MHIGLGLQLANLDRKVSDGDVYRRELAVAARAEEAGFDSIWVSEHHFSDYQLSPQQFMVLSWLAAQTKRVGLGTYVSVLPWSDPVRTAESFVVLDHLSGGRALLGLGRGLGQREFVGFRTPMGESRRRFTEYSEAILAAIESGVMAYDGELYKQPAVEIRPRPAWSFRGRTFASAVSPQSMDLMARMGVGLLVIAQKPWQTTEAELKAYRERYFELNNQPAPKPVLVVLAGTSRNPVIVERIGAQYLQRWARSTVEHYEFDNPRFSNIEGYEYYAALAANITRYGLDNFNRFLADLQVWGTPEQVTERLQSYVERTDAGALVVVPMFGGMSTDEARGSFEVFAEDVLPALHRLDAGGDIGVTYAVPSALLARGSSGRD